MVHKKISSKIIPSEKRSSRSEKKVSKRSRSADKPVKKTKIIYQEEDSIEELTLEDLENLDEVQEKAFIEKQIKGVVEKNMIDEELRDDVNKEMYKEKPAKAPVKVTKKPKKEAIIDKMLEGYEKLNIPEADRLSRAALKSCKLNILEQRLASLTERLALEILKIDTPKELDKTPSSSYTISDELAVISLYNLNLVMTTFVEELGKTARQNETIKDYVPNIDGFTDNLRQTEKAKVLKECLKEIIKQHGESIKPFMNPIAIWLCLMLTTASEQVAKNSTKVIEKKSDQCDIKSLP